MRLTCISAIGVANNHLNVSGKSIHNMVLQPINARCHQAGQVHCFVHLSTPVVPILLTCKLIKAG